MRRRAGRESAYRRADLCDPIDKHEEKSPSLSLQRELENVLEIICALLYGLSLCRAVLERGSVAN